MCVKIFYVVLAISMYETTLEIYLMYLFLCTLYIMSQLQSGQQGATTSTSGSTGNSAASDMGPNAISINIGGQGWGVGGSGRGAEGPASDQHSFGDADDYGHYGSALSPVSGYSLMSGSRAGGRRRKRRKRGRRSRRRGKRKTRRRRRKTRTRTRRRHRRRRRRRRRTRRNHRRSR